MRTSILSSSRRAPIALFCLLAACGGKVVFESDEDPLGAGGATSSVATSTSAMVTSTSAVTSTSTSATTSSTGVGGAPPIPPLVETDYGVIQDGQTVTFDAPPGILGFSVVAQVVDPKDAFEVAGIRSIVSPQNNSLVSNWTIPSTYAGFYNYGITAASVPQSDAPGAMPPAPGPFQITAEVPSFTKSVPTQVSVWHRQTVDGKFHGGVLDVNLFIAGGAQPDWYAQDAIMTAYEGFAGLSLGTVTLYTLGSEWLTIDENNFYQLFEQTAGAAGKPALNIMVVAALTGQLEGAAGVTPAAPANALDHGTHLSGIVVTMFGDPTIDSVILRHETGHFAGLLHTSEFDAGVGDALSDTKFCPDVMSTLEGCPDYDNLMFPTGGDFSMTLTPSQLRVIEGSTIYRGIVESGGGPADPLGIMLGGPGGSSGSATGSVLPTRSLEAIAREPWAASLSLAAARDIAGLWCGGPSGAPSQTPYARLLALPSVDARALLAIGADSSAPGYVRRRALAAVGHAKPSDRVVSEIAAIARDRGADRQTRLGAIEGIRAASPAASLALAGRLAGDPDAVLAEVAARAAR